MFYLIALLQQWRPPERIIRTYPIAFPKKLIREKNLKTLFFLLTFVVNTGLTLSEEHLTQI